MALLNRFSCLLLIVLLIAAGASSQIRAAEPLRLEGDGWYTWQIESVGEYAEEIFYVQMKAGKPKEIEIAGRWCNSRNRSDQRHPEATDLGLLEADQSIDWFEQYIGTRSDLSSDALAAISMHESDRALKILIGIVESDADMDIREDAVFWMAQSDSEAAFNYLDRLLMID
jgi:hypothetical protein